MRSKTSFFNKTVFLKNMGRFWPVWGAYLAAWLLILPYPLLSRVRNYAITAAAVQSWLLDMGVRAGVIMALIFGGLMAMAVWSFLYNSRSAYGTASLPLTRSCLFFSNVTAGLVPLLGANLIIAALSGLAGSAAAGGAAFAAAAQWFGVASLAVIFFYGFATLCAQLTGSIVIMPLVYAVLNFTAFVVETIVRVLLSEFVYGYSTGIGMSGYAARWLSPAVGILSAIGTHPVHDERITASGERVRDIVGFTFYGWRALILYAAVGIVLFALALLLLRKRKMETAGDVVAVKALKPVFRWCMALGCALVLSVLVYTLVGVAHSGDNSGFLTTLIFMLVGAFIGWFAAQMLMKKSFRVFTGGWGGWAGFGVCCLVIVGLMLCMKADVFGYERYVPATEQVESALLRVNGEAVQLTEPENIEGVRALHASAVAHKDEYTGLRYGFSDYYDQDRRVSSFYCNIEYNLKNGRTVERVYYLYYNDLDPLDSMGSDAVAAQDLLNTPEGIAYRKRTAFEFTPETVYSGEVTAEYTPEELEKMGFSYGYDGFYDGYDYATPVERSQIQVLNLDAAEAWELYSTCIVPDFADGTLGKIWVLQDDSYYEEVYAASVYIYAHTPLSEADRALKPDAGEWQESYIRTTPTVDSRRTNAWLAAHGITLHLAGEVEG